MHASRGAQCTSRAAPPGWARWGQRTTPLGAFKPSSPFSPFGPGLPSAPFLPSWPALPGGPFKPRSPGTPAGPGCPGELYGSQSSWYLQAHANHCCSPPVHACRRPGMREFVGHSTYIRLPRHVRVRVHASGLVQAHAYDRVYTSTRVRSTQQHRLHERVAIQTRSPTKRVGAMRGEHRRAEDGAEGPRGYSSMFATKAAML